MAHLRFPREMLANEVPYIYTFLLRITARYDRSNSAQSLTKYYKELIPIKHKFIHIYNQFFNLC